MRLTTAKYYTPSERVIHEKGIDPDVVVPVSPGEWQDVQARRARIENPELFADQEMPENLARAVDRPLERAVDLLKGILLFESRE
jgi:carboxyl-terminal processing protease